MNIKTIVLLHPGNMGSTIGAAAATSGARVVWASERRSKASRERAKQAGLIDVETLPNALRESEVVLSVCPPHAALEVAQSVAQYKFKGIYVDANAISRATAVQVGEIVTKAGASFVDGGIIGAPVKKAGITRLYLSGFCAPEVAKLFSASMLDARAIGPEPGAASAGARAPLPAGRSGGRSQDVALRGGDGRDRRDFQGRWITRWLSHGRRGNLPAPYALQRSDRSGANDSGRSRSDSGPVRKTLTLSLWERARVRESCSVSNPFAALI